MRALFLLAGLSGIVLMAACSQITGKPAPPPQAVLRFSPNGEPLTGGPLGQASCSDAQERWFDRMTANQGGVLSREAFLADARTQFARMDLDHDGWITPAELSEYRAPYMPEPPPQSRNPKDRPSPRDAASQQVAHNLSQTDPVMSADTQLLFRVSQADFMAQAEDLFSRLNRSHSGSLNRVEITAFCREKP